MRFKRISVLFLVLLTFFAMSTPSSFAVKTGSSCKKLNSKGWDGNSPVICKKNSKGKLIWTTFKETSSNTSKPTTPVTPKLFNVNVSLETGFALNRGALGAAVDPADTNRWCMTGVVFIPSLENGAQKSKVGSQIRLESNGNIVSLGSLTSYVLNGQYDLPNSKYGAANQLAGMLCTLKGILTNVPELNFYTLFIDDIRAGDFTLKELKNGIQITQWK